MYIMYNVYGIWYEKDLIYDALMFNVREYILRN
jgi:hypothetical protein